MGLMVKTGNYGRTPFLIPFGLGRDCCSLCLSAAKVPGERSEGRVLAIEA